MAPFFALVDVNQIDHAAFDVFPDRNIHQSLPWIRFIANTQGAEPFIAAFKEGNTTLGYFTGLTVKKFGFKILGSPFRGWSTTYMGFNLQPGVPRCLAITALVDFAFNELGYDHLELMDRFMTPTDCCDLNFETYMFKSYEIDLTPGEEEIFSRMTHPCRNAIRKAEKCGVIVEEAHDMEFADEYYAQLKHVYAVKNLVPPFRRNRVRELIRFIQPTGGLLMLRARNKEGISIATGIFAATGSTVFYWGQASLREYSGVRPNEAATWYAMKYWKERGMRVFDMVGPGQYKKKFGGCPIMVPWVRKSRKRWVAFVRRLAEGAFYEGQGILGKLLTPPIPVEGGKKRN